jgi:hypothetical protein
MIVGLQYEGNIFGHLHDQGDPDLSIFEIGTFLASSVISRMSLLLKPSYKRLKAGNFTNSSLKYYVKESYTQVRKCDQNAPHLSRVTTKSKENNL